MKQIYLFAYFQLDKVDFYIFLYLKKKLHTLMFFLLNDLGIKWVYVKICRVP